jgi:hypothetical protein
MWYFDHRYILNKGVFPIFSLVAQIVASFKSRVFADGGTFEAESCLNTNVQDLVSKGIYDSASLIVTPNGVKSGKIYALKGSDLTFTRASVANRTNSVGVLESMATGVPRIEYPSGGGCPSILLEPQRTNYAIQSANPSLWSVYQGVINTAIANDLLNGYSSYLIYTSTGNVLSGQAYLALASGVNVAVVVTYSAKVKAAGKNWVYLGGIRSGFSPLAWFNVSTGVIGTVLSGITAKIISESNGYYTISITGAIAGATPYAVVGASDADNSTANALVGSNGFRLAYFGAEIGNYATSPIITTTTSVTRIFDDASSVISAVTEGTLFIDLTQVTESTSTGNPDLSITDTTFNAWVGLTTNTAANPLRILFRNIGTTLIDYQNANTSGKIAIRFGAAGVTVYLNGVLVASSATAFNSSFTKTRMSCGAGFLVKFKQFDVLGALTSSQLIALTT